MFFRACAFFIDDVLYALFFSWWLGHAEVQFFFGWGKFFQVDTDGLQIEPDGNFIHYYYAITKASPEERIAELEVIVEKLKSPKSF